MNFRHIWLIAKREYLQRVRTLGFILGTLIGAVGIIALAFAPMLIDLLDRQSTLKIAVVDPHNIITPYLPQDVGTARPTVTPGDLTQNPVSLSAGLRFIRAPIADPARLSEQVRQGEINAYLVVSGTRPADLQFTYHSDDRPGPATTARLLAVLTSAATQARLRESGISPEQAQALFGPPPFKVEPIVQGTLRDERAYFQSAAVVYLLLVLLYITILLYGMQVATGVVEEKSSRVMELLITAVRPLDMMIGKVLGVAIAGLTQYGIWVLTGLLLLLVNILPRGSQFASGVNIEYVPAETLVFFFMFFLLGFLLYAFIYAGIGSLVSRTEDVNGVVTPLSLITISTYFISIWALNSPDAPLVRWLSLVPFFTPMLMFIRVALGSVEWWELALSLVFLVGTGLLFAWVGAKIYRVGVLMYGKRPSFREVARLLRAA
jgi:ABC-2 type transport system permease protein